MNLTVYLLRDVVSELDQLQLREGFRELKPEETLPFPCVAWVQANRPTPPKWASWLGTAFDVGGLRLQNQSNSFVLFLKVDKRIFALTFGYGLSAIERSLIEPDFGLKVTLNEVDPDALDMVDTRRVDRVSRQRRTHLNVGRGVSDFDISTELDWIRKVSGRPLSTTLTKKMVGADSLKVAMKCSVLELGEHCRTFFKQYRKRQYKKRFGFIDHLRPLKPKDPLLPKLEAKLVGMLTARSHEWIAVAFPEMPDEDISTWKLSQGHGQKESEDLDIERVYAFLDAHPNVSIAPEKIWVRGYNSEGFQLTSKDTLHLYLVAQVDHDGATYVLSLGQWFRVDTDYITKVREQVRALPDVTSRLQLPTWSNAFKREGDYNEHVGNHKNWLVLDAKPFHPDGSTGKLEVCDLLSPDREFIHVKDMKDSATLSHLFGQGSVSATVFKLESTHADRVKDHFHGFYGNARAFDHVEGPLWVVYAIATSKPGHLADTLFFFSVVNLLQHARTVRLAGFEVALCRIEREGREA
ncbi:hypothetical protein D7V97_27375 [Corallococcus sp. CA053C]|uniref:DUF6119 family protein n=1 Tax=Corallococcus sp. CA053C TaxID=2316732 RepID=UPI000EA38E39|nr:DUF6119 family protein [Corallococcus sp. CA053C]RKH02841.1 hypothetical protein D7V97_27375 [Corallococcus sp. CA053C]